MTVLCFVDTNVVVYARDNSEPEKQRIADAWLASLWQRRAGRISAQVINECYWALVRRRNLAMPEPQARAYAASFFAWRPMLIGRQLIETGWQVHDRFGFSWWDSLIVAAAQRSRCTHLLSEDLNHGQDLGGVQVVNPFRVSPSELMR